MADPFHLNADYMKGTLYEGRRCFLGSTDAGGKGSLMPPMEFMTKKQARVALKIARDSTTVDFNHVLHIKNAHSANKSSDDSRPHGGETKHQKQREGEKTNKRTGKQKRKDVIIVEEFSSLRPEDWAELNQAGVKAWVNHSTGEVSGVCPWKVYSEPGVGSSGGGIGSTTSATAVEVEGGSDEVVAGTGSLVYDSSEFDSFMDSLDELVEKEQRTLRK